MPPHLGDEALTEYQLPFRTLRSRNKKMPETITREDYKLEVSKAYIGFPSREVEGRRGLEGEKRIGRNKAVSGREVESRRPSVCRLS
nr:hypothetical protein Iba_chr10cCG4230 [Ipomoea batatas]